jgi:histone H3/H4
MSASAQPGAFFDSDEDNASIDTSDLKSGDIDSLDKTHDLHTDDDDDSENNDDDHDDDEDDDDSIPVASIVASVSLSDDDAADDEKEGNAAAKASSAKSADKKKTTADETTSTPSSSGKRKAVSSPESSAKKRQPAAKGLFVPFRTVKKIMQQDPDINIIQNDAAIMVTAATGLFLKEFTEKSLESCKKKGRNTIKYDDVAEVRAKNKNYAFLDMLLP